MPICLDLDLESRSRSVHHAKEISRNLFLHENEISLDSSRIYLNLELESRF